MARIKETSKPIKNLNTNTTKNKTNRRTTEISFNFLQQNLHIILTEIQMLFLTDELRMNYFRTTVSSKLRRIFKVLTSITVNSRFHNR